MNIPDFLTAGAELELVASKLYGTLSNLSSDPGLAKQLRSLANDETNHANIIRRGKRYHEEMPDVFSRILVEDDEVQKGIEEGNSFHALLVPGYSLLDALKKMLEFERRFEKVHIAASVEITDPSLKRLFMGLTKSDKSHIATLSKLIESRGNIS